MPDLRTLLGDRYAPALQAAVLADNPEAITSAQAVGGKLGQLMYLAAVDRLARVLARALPQLAAWQDRKRRDRDITPPHVIAHRGAQLDAVAAERDALAAKVERVRDWLDRRGVDVSDRDDDYMRGYRAAQRHALQDAAELRRPLDAEA